MLKTPKYAVGPKGRWHTTSPSGTNPMHPPQIPLMNPYYIQHVVSLVLFCWSDIVRKYSVVVWLVDMPSCWVLPLCA